MGPDAMRMLGTVAAAIGLCGCTDFSDTFAIRNATGAELTVTIESRERLTSYDCDASDGAVDLGLGGTVTISPGRRRCFEGPVCGACSYDARDSVAHIAIDRGATRCVDESGEDLKGRSFVVEGYHGTWTVDDVTCR